MIVRTPEAAENIRRYIRMNPWKCTQNFGNNLRGMGNPALWNAEKVGVMCSRTGSPRRADIPAAEQRNRFVIQNADRLYVPHITPGGMLDRQHKEKNI